MHLSVLLTSLPVPFEQAVGQVAALGFGHCDVLAHADRPAAHRDALAEAGLGVTCVSIGKDLADGVTLDDPDVGRRRAALEETRRHIADAAQLGATHCYLIPGLIATPAGLACFAEACSLLADYAGQRMVRLLVEHIPGRALPTVADTLAWLQQLDHANVQLLLDVGHCLISAEEPAQAIEQAGPRLGYVHLDDNDGSKDCHWPLLTGKLTEKSLRDGLTALVRFGYDGALTLELNAKNADPVGALREGREIIRRFLPSVAG
jgi:sugar phosphate isomerase/epimerase